MRKTITLVSERQVRLLERLLEKVETKSLSSLVGEGVEIMEEILSLMEERWMFLSCYFKEVLGTETPLPRKFPAETVKDFLIDLYHLSMGRERFVNSSFLLLFGEELARKAELPVRETSRKINQAFWGVFRICETRRFWEVFSPECTDKWREFLKGKGGEQN